MAPVIPGYEPTRFAANTTVKWTRAFGSLPPSDTWTLKYSFRGPGAFDVDADGSGSAWAITITPALTASQPAGTYRWSAVASRGSGETLERYPVASGRVVLTPDLLEVGVGAVHEFAEKMLPIVEAAISGRLTADQESITIDGTAITRIPMEQLVALRNRFRHEIRLAQNGGRLPPKAVRFGLA